MITQPHRHTRELGYDTIIYFFVQYTMNNTAESPPIVEPSSEPPPDNKTKSKMLPFHGTVTQPIQIPTSKWIPKGSEEHPYKHLM